MTRDRAIERTLAVYATPDEADMATRARYMELSPNERVALTVELQRRYYQDSDPPRRLQRILTVLERS